MTAIAPTVDRCFQAHGIPVAVSATDENVIEAMELRLRDFRSAPHRCPALRLEFGTGVGEEVGAGRPVYDTPYGSLHYCAETDVLSGALDGVSLRCEAGRGVSRISASEFTGRALYLATHPLATISLMEMLERRGLFALHAGCLATSGGRGVLLAGASGAGKSTLALALARAGMRFLSDDIVFLDGGARGPVRVLGFADTVGVSAFAARSFGELRVPARAPRRDGFPKPLTRIETLFGRPALAACDPVALVFPHVAPDRPSQVESLDSRDALLALVPDVLLTEPAATQAHLRAIGALLEQVRCYALRSGADLARAAALVEELV